MSGRGPVKRADRLGEILRKELSELLVRGVVRDPRVEGVVVSAVRLTDDLGQAKVYVRVLGEATPRRREELVEALEGAAGALRRALAPALRTKVVPALSFFWDESIDRALRMERLLQEIAEESEGETEREGEP